MRILELIKGLLRYAGRVHNDKDGGQPVHGCRVHSFATARERAISDCRSVELLEKALAAERGGAADWSESDQIRALIPAAKCCGLFLDRSQVASLGVQISKRTGESLVRWNASEAAFYKIKNPLAKQPIKQTNFDDWLYEHIIHNILFPETAYEFVGVAEEHHEGRLVLRQQAVKTELLPTDEAIMTALSRLGLRCEDRYFFGNDYLAVTDVGGRGDNVLLGDDGELYFIDPLIRLKRPAKEVVAELIKP